MKKTSRVVRLSSIDPSAPWWSMAGPEETLIATPSSLAMMCASVVLPRPGGPQRSTCSTAPARRFEQDAEVFAHLLLADILREEAGAQRQVELLVVGSSVQDDVLFAHCSVT